MTPIELTLACGSYDRTIPLQDGSVEPEGIDLTVVQVALGELFRRQARGAEFEVAELSLSTYSILRARGDQRMIAIPVFPSRKFRHSHIFINSDLIESPSDLIGRRIGCSEYQNSASTWMRGLLQDDFGVSPDSVTWLVGGLNAPSRESERIPITLPEGLVIEQAGGDQNLSNMLANGEIAANVTPRVPDSFQDDSPVRRLFPNYYEVERDYYLRTGIFPIMHTVVIRSDVYEQWPWTASSLMKAFVEAKSVGNSRLRYTGALYCALPFLAHHLDELDALTQGRDMFEYGLEANRHVLSAFLRYGLDQGLIAKPLDVDELFAEETLDT